MNSATIMLIPDITYREARPKTTEHHLTVAYFGKVSEIDANGLARLHNTVRNIAQSTGPIQAKANGIGVFNAGKDGFALVDLIDGIGTFNVRRQIENLFGEDRLGYTIDGVKIDYTHGFTPHITREYLPPEDDFYAEITPDMIDNITFQFEAIGLWFGDQKYEVAL